MSKKKSKNNKQMPRLEGCDGLDLITHEIENCIRQIFAFINVMQLVRKNNYYEINNLYGWIKYILLKLIITDSCKIKQDSKKELLKVIETFYPEQVDCDSILSDSKYRIRITRLNKLIESSTNFRNKRFCHIELVECEKVNVELILLLNALTDLKNSVEWIKFKIHNINDDTPCEFKKEQCDIMLSPSNITENNIIEHAEKDSIIKTMREELKLTEPYAVIAESV